MVGKKGQEAGYHYDLCGQLGHAIKVNSVSLEFWLLDV